jgi:hypothetical protein
MNVVENVLAGLERLVMPKLSAIEARLTVLENKVDTELKAIRELMAANFKAVNERFDALDDKFAFDRRLTAVEERQQKDPQQ